MLLLVNTAQEKEIKIALLDESGDDVATLNESIHYQQETHKKLLPLIDKLLKKNKMSLEKLSGIVVVSGPGGFAALRAGIALANGLGYSLNIPVIGILLDEFLSGKYRALIKRNKKKKFSVAVFPAYGSEPKITLRQAQGKQKSKK